MTTILGYHLLKLLATFFKIKTLTYESIFRPTISFLIRCQKENILRHDVHMLSY